MIMERYIKHINFEGIGESGQARLLSSTVFIVGAGGLGTNFSNHFVRAGVGNIRIIDHDKVELSNLQRQLFYEEADIGSYKVEALCEKLRRVNSEIKLEGIRAKLDESNAAQLIGKPDLLIDASDNFKTRFIIDRFCKDAKLPWIFTGIIASGGQSCFIHPDDPTLADIMNTFGLSEHDDLSSLEPGDSVSVLSPSVSALSSFAASIAIKFLVNRDDPSVRKKIYFLDPWEESFKVLPLV